MKFNFVASGDVRKDHLFLPSFLFVFAKHKLLDRIKISHSQSSMTSALSSHSPSQLHVLMKESTAVPSGKAMAGRQETSNAVAYLY